ncbi:hypothetical protein O181_008790 [Austropuccinia psidii MF-1]|uniref:Uncharacterized protein n=1 Tax=Austropuccinia psidii MF-1 TaxID=1389203 RepID=A0A9Q3GJ85_9BASI|nr:hypothetical protein [Austropuccinia psidii MF-1]
MLFQQFFVTLFLILACESKSNLKLQDLSYSPGARENRAASQSLEQEIGQLLTTIHAAQAPFQKACAANQASEVVQSFALFQRSFQRVASICSKSYNFDREQAKGHSAIFVKVLFELQNILRTLNAYPQIQEQCQRPLRTISMNLNTIISFYKALKVDLNAEIGLTKQPYDPSVFSNAYLKLNLHL